jgi:hypothetical protein
MGSLFKTKKQDNSSVEQKYPHFIQNKPCGADRFEGQSQRRLTEAIADHIISTDSGDNTSSQSRIIGLEGSWGIGKSNVIKQLKEMLKDRYYLFEYDAWGHQEDLQRRSFLELLTDSLINDAKILEKEQWEEKLNNFLAKKIVRVNKTIPKINARAFWVAIIIIATPIAKFIAERLAAEKKIEDIVYLSLIAFSPIILGIISWLISMIFKKEMRNIGYLLKIIKNETVETENQETINEDEPTVTKFKSWMKDISEHIKAKKKQRLIVVYDNMDRLPAEKVKELWSSIHTFFSEDGFDNIWAIIPFDEEHLSCAFGEKDQRVQLTKYFISKTFPVVYRVTPPVITDFKKIFNILFEEAFPKTESAYQDDINRIFKIENPSATVRDMIIFINQLVALKTIWKNEIDILSMAIFTLKKDLIIKDAINQILSGEYLGNNISITNDEKLQKNISALTYGILPDDAEQIPISKYIESCLKLEEGYDINRYAAHKHFILVLKDKIENNDLPTDTLINALSRLNHEYEEQYRNTIVNFWNSFSRNKLIMPLEKQEFDSIFRLLLIHTDKQYQQNIIQYLCNKFQNIQEFNGGTYFNSINSLNNFLNEKKIDNRISEYIVDIEKSPEIFFDYISQAKDNYAKYKLKADPNKLDEFFSNLLPDELKNTDIIKILINDKSFKFDITLKKIEELISKDTSLQLISGENIYSLFNTYKILSNKKPLAVQLTLNQRNSMWNSVVSKPKTNEFLEILTMQLGNGFTYSETLDDKQIEYISKNIDYYGYYGNLLINIISCNIPALNQILKYMTENGLGHNLVLENVLPVFFEIKTKINVTEVVLLEQLDRWNRFISGINKENIQTIIPEVSFFQYSIITKNTLADHLNKTIIEALSGVSVDVLYQQRTNLENYWFLIINNFIGTDYLKSLPDNLLEFGKKILNDIASSRQTIPEKTDLFQKIIDKLNKKETAAQIKDIRDMFCNSQYKISPQLFIYLIPWFEHQGDLLSRSADVVHKIIEPVINDDNCLEIILSKIDYFSKIINDAGDDSTGIRKKIKEKMETSKDERLIKLEKKIIKE